MRVKRIASAGSAFFRFYLLGRHRVTFSSKASHTGDFKLCMSTTSDRAEVELFLGLAYLVSCGISDIPKITRFKGSTCTHLGATSGRGS